MSTPCSRTYTLSSLSFSRSSCATWPALRACARGERRENDKRTHLASLGTRSMTSSTKWKRSISLSTHMSNGVVVVPSCAHASSRSAPAHLNTHLFESAHVQVAVRRASVRHSVNEQLWSSDAHTSTARAHAPGSRERRTRSARRCRRSGRTPCR
jgi:hypothetical protein